MNISSLANFLPIPLPLAANRMSQGQPKGGMYQPAVVGAAVIFHPSRMGGVLVQVARADVVVLASWQGGETRRPPAEAGGHFLWAGRMPLGFRGMPLGIGQFAGQAVDAALRLVPPGDERQLVPGGWEYSDCHCSKPFSAQRKVQGEPGDDCNDDQSEASRCHARRVNCLRPEPFTLWGKAGPAFLEPPAEGKNGPDGRRAHRQDDDAFGDLD